MPLGQLTTELVRWIQGRIDLALQAALRVREGVGDIFGTQSCAHYHHIDITASLLGPFRHRAEDEGQLNPACQWLQSLAQHVHHSKRLPHQRPQFRKHRALRVGCIVGLPPLYRPPQNSGFGELFQLPLNGARPQCEVPNDLPLVEAALRVPIE